MAGGIRMEQRGVVLAWWAGTAEAVREIAVETGAQCRFCDGVSHPAGQTLGRWKGMREGPGSRRVEGAGCTDPGHLPDRLVCVDLCCGSRTLLCQRGQPCAGAAVDWAIRLRTCEGWWRPAGLVTSGGMATGDWPEPMERTAVIASASDRLRRRRRWVTRSLRGEWCARWLVG